MWERLLDLAPARGVELGMAFLDGTSIRAHEGGGGGAKGGLEEDEERVKRLAEAGADRGCSSHALRDHGWSLGARPAVPPKPNEEQFACPDHICANCNRVERLWSKLKGRAAKRTDRALATRCEKTAQSFTGALSLAAASNWLRR